MLAYSRILNDEEAVVVNTSTTTPFSGFVSVDSPFCPPGTVMQARHSNQDGAIDQLTVTSTATGIRIEEVDGSARSDAADKPADSTHRCEVRAG